LTFSGIQAAYGSFFILTPFPNTVMYEEALARATNGSHVFGYGAVSANCPNMASADLLKSPERLSAGFTESSPHLAIIRTTPTNGGLVESFIRTLRSHFWDGNLANICVRMAYLSCENEHIRNRNTMRIFSSDPIPPFPPRRRRWGCSNLSAYLRAHSPQQSHQHLRCALQRIQL